MFYWIGRFFRQMQTRNYLVADIYVKGTDTPLTKHYVVASREREYFVTWKIISTDVPDLKTGDVYEMDKLQARGVLAHVQTYHSGTDLERDHLGKLI